MMRKMVFVVLLFALALSVSVNPVQAGDMRIVSLVPSITENLFALGVGNNVVGVTSWCTYPEEAQERAIVGDAFNLNLEVLLDLEPDLVVGDSSLVAAHLDKLEELGIAVFTVAPATYEEVADSLIELGEAVGAREAGEALAQKMLERRDTLVSLVPSGLEQRVFVETWNEPVSTAGPGSFIDELIVLAGGHNIASDADGPWVQFSEELIIERDPEIILLTNYNKTEVMDRSSWNGLTAVQTQRVYEVNPDIFSRTGLRLADALETLIDLFY